MTAKLFRLFKYYPKNIGLTIPFILGALRQPVGQVLPPAESFEELRVLLVALRDETHPDLLKAQILRCPNLDEPIVTFFGAEVSGSVRFDSPSTQGRALYVSLYGIFDNDFELLVDNLWELYEPILSQGFFSRQKEPQKDKKWDKFSQTELTNLRNLCSIE